LVILGWAAGYLIWQPESPGDVYGSGFDTWTPRITVLIGGPLAVAAGVLLSRAGLLRVLGYVALGLTVVVLAYLASFAFFGGFCLDAGDTCITTWPSRLVELVLAVSCVLAGWLAQQGAARLFRRN
jgi:hypothetical protein